MNRRGFLGGLLAGAGLIVLPEPEPVRVYSFASRYCAEQAELERVLRVSAATGLPVPPGVYGMHRHTEFPIGAKMLNCVVKAGPDGCLMFAGDHASGVSQLIGNVFSWRDEPTRRLWLERSVTLR